MDQADGEAGVLAELVAGVGVVYGQALARLDLPAAVATVPGQVILAANEAAADLFDVDLSDLTGRRPADFDLFDVPHLDRMYAAMADGDVSGYRVRRAGWTGKGKPIEFDVWGRVVEFDGARCAAFLMKPVAEPRTGGAGVSLSTLPLESMAVGTATPGWIVERVSSELQAILGRDPHSVVDRQFLTDIHPDDVGVLERGTRSLDEGDVALLHLRLRHANGSWVPTHTLAMRMSKEAPPRIAFALIPAPPQEEPAVTDRVTELEHSLRRIAGELEAAGFLGEVDRLPSLDDFPQLASLSNRQWQILARLLRGTRVPAIANELHLSKRTVRNYLSEMFTVFDVHSQSELISLLASRP